jgi:hypothetical protein
LGESPAKSGPEEEQQEPDQRRYEQRDDLVLDSIVLPEGERFGGSRLAGRIIPQQEKADEEQESGQRSGQRQKAIESVGDQDVPLVGVPSL